MHKVAILALDDVVPSDLSLPCDLLGAVRIDGAPGYELRVVGAASVVRSRLFEIRAPHDLTALASADTILVPGIYDVAAEIPAEVIQALRAAADRGARIAAICSGAFVLAAAGLLDHRRATTHWLATAELARRYPRITVEHDVLYVDEGRVLTSAGAAAALDLCLHLVRSDHGAAVAAAAARMAVAPLERSGAQAQRIRPPLERPTLEPVLRWIETSAELPLRLPAIARRAGMSVRTLTRRFREQTGTTPHGWLALARVRRAQQLLETTELSVDEIAGRCGLASAASLREQFHQQLGTSPAEWRKSHRPRAARPESREG